MLKPDVATEAMGLTAQVVLPGRGDLRVVPAVVRRGAKRESDGLAVHRAATDHPAQAVVATGRMVQAAATTAR